MKSINVTPQKMYSVDVEAIHGWEEGGRSFKSGGASPNHLSSIPKIVKEVLHLGDMCIIGAQGRTHCPHSMSLPFIRLCTGRCPQDQPSGPETGSQVKPC